MTAINEQPCSNSKVAHSLVARAGRIIKFTLQRDDGEETLVTLTRGGKSLGLVMDARNAVVELVPDSAAATHGGIQIGDRILAINDFKVAPGENIVSLFPSGGPPPRLSTLPPAPGLGLPCEPLPPSRHPSCATTALLDPSSTPRCSPLTHLSPTSPPSPLPHLPPHLPLPTSRP